MSVIAKRLKTVFKGVSWNNPFINLCVHLADAPDWVVRQMNGTAHLPKFSVRVRSGGVRNQFGGKLFHTSGMFTVQLLRQYGQLQPTDQVVEIGCGSGRSAIALSDFLQPGHYLGFDIDSPSLNACRSNAKLMQKNFRFELIDVRNELYNPTGSIEASAYRFPYPDGDADFIFMFSVFTHMLPADVASYIREIGRMLKTGGHCFATVFLMDHGHLGKVLDFPFDHGEYRLHVADNPAKAIGYQLAYFQQEFQKNQMSLVRKPVLGSWRSGPPVPDVEWGQDILVFRKS